MSIAQKHHHFPPAFIENPFDHFSRIKCNYVTTKGTIEIDVNATKTNNEYEKRRFKRKKNMKMPQKRGNSMRILQGKRFFLKKKTPDSYKIFG